MMRNGSLDDSSLNGGAIEPNRSGAGPIPAAEWLPETAAMSSPRLRRASEYFAAQEGLMHDLRWQVELELAPFADLMQRRETTTRETLANLEPQLAPLNAYVQAEETNLKALERNLADGNMGHLSRSFSKHAELLRERIAETRRHIDEQRAPFIRYHEDERKVVDVALMRLDTDLSALEQNLAEQRRVMHRLLEAMRSEAFVAARDLLLAREAVLEELTAGGVTDPAEIVACLQSLRGDVDVTNTGAQLQRVLAATDAADARLAGAAGAIAPPRPGSLDALGIVEAGEESVAAQLEETLDDGTSRPRELLRRPWA